MKIQLNHIECGQGAPLILLHGNGENLSYFEHQTPEFSKHFRVFAVDTRGHGESPRGTAPFTIAQFAEDLKDFMDGKGLEKAHLLGFSDGANIALAFAMKYPERVDRLILNGGNLNPWGVKLAVQLPIVLGYGLCAMISVWDKKAVAKKELLGLMVNEPKLRPADLAGVKLPTMVIAGTKDMIRTAHTVKIHRAIAGSRLELIDGDHFIANRRPEAFNRAVLSFLTEKRGSGDED